MKVKAFHFENAIIFSLFLKLNYIYARVMIIRDNNKRALIIFSEN